MGGVKGGSYGNAQVAFVYLSVISSESVDLY